MFGGGIILIILISVFMFNSSTSVPSSVPSSSPASSSPSSSSPSSSSPPSSSPASSSPPSSSPASIPSVNCVGDWDACSAPCGTGTQKYKITTPKVGDGTNCPFQENASQSCKIKDCPVNCVGAWSGCSEGCGPGVQTYNISTNKQGDGSNCEAGNGTVRPCNNKACAATWPAYSASPFSIKLRNTNKCLHPEGGDWNAGQGTNLVLWEGCNEDRLKYKVFTNGVGGSIQHYRPPGTVLGGKCLWPENGGNNRIAARNEVIKFKSGCDDSQPGQMAHTLRYTLENGKIINNKSGLCLKTDHGGDGAYVRLQDCSNASVFDLV